MQRPKEKPRSSTSCSVVQTVHLRIQMHYPHNHASLQWLFRQNADGMNFRMVQNFQEYDYQIVHRPGDKHCKADGLSRGPIDVHYGIEWLSGERDALRGPNSDFTEFDSALFEAERDLRAARTKAREKI